MFCTKCGNEIDEGANFCTNCGAKVGENKEEVTETKDAKKNNLQKGDLAGIPLGISLAWALGLNGIIPYALGIMFGIFIARKMLNGTKGWVQLIFWIILITMFAFGSVMRSVNSEYNYSTFDSSKDITILDTDKSHETSQVSGNLYRNTKYNFRIKFPEGWEIRPGDGLHIVQKATYEDSTISVVVQEFDLGGETMSSIKDTGSVDEFVNMAIEGIKQKFSDVKVIDYGETRIDNEPAYWVEYSANTQILDTVLDAKYLTYSIAKGTVLYTISAGTASDKYEEIKPFFTQSVGTFVLEKY